MTPLDWITMAVLLGGIVVYGVYKSRTQKSLEGYFLSDRNLPWYLVLLSIMGTQASAITFLSGPGQAYADGMRFVQYYFGLPLAMVVICITFVPLFRRQRVLTAYEFLERRFDLRTRTLTSFLFLLQRGLSTGISIYAPSIILSTLFGWDIFWTNLGMGGLLIVYTVSGGAKAVAYTQQIQLVIIFAAMAIAGYWVVREMPAGVGFGEALEVGGKMGRMNVVTSGRTDGAFDWSDRYNIWSGVIGGFFLALSYFGTDQSQVGRYLTGNSTRESRLGLLMNGLVKIPMQAGILLIGVLIFSFYQFRPAPISHNSRQVDLVAASPKADSLRMLQQQVDSVTSTKAVILSRLVGAEGEEAEQGWDSVRQLEGTRLALSKDFRRMYTTVSGEKDANDTNYVFLSWVKTYLPAGLKGLLIAIIFLAAWGSIAAALNSLAASTVVDFHQRFGAVGNDAQAYAIAKRYTVAWGIFSIVVAQFAHGLGQSLIEAVNVLGSLFYGVILGIFLVAFYVKRVGGNVLFPVAIAMQVFVVILFFNEKIPAMRWLPDLSFLWMNAIGALGVVALASGLASLSSGKPQRRSN